MDNQQPSIPEERIQLLARNAIFGDGYLWKHPQCKHWKAIWTSTTPELLEAKRPIAPNYFAREFNQHPLAKGEVDSQMHGRSSDWPLLYTRYSLQRTAPLNKISSRS